MISPRARILAVLALVFLAGLAASVLVVLVRSPLRGLLLAVLVLGGLVLGIEGLLRSRRLRWALLGAAAIAVIAAVVVLLVGDLLVEVIVLVVLLGAALVCARSALRIHVHLPRAIRPERPVVFWNPRSGDGKAARADLATQARNRGIEPVELRPGDDLEDLVRAAVARGADALGAAGGDGTQAVVAALAAEHDLPYACIPAGTRNHFALDLGVDRDDVVGALDAFVDGGEKRVDLGEVNGRTFVNNVSLGVYAEAVQRSDYRGAKVRTLLDTAAQVMGPGPTPGGSLRWVGPDGSQRADAAVILVSNNVYRLGRAVGSGTRPRMDEAVLGLAVLPVPGAGLTALQWSAPAFDVQAEGAVPVGVDGEGMRLDAPLRFAVRAGVLRVRVARAHPGASPSSAIPGGRSGVLVALWRTALGRHPGAVGG